MRTLTLMLVIHLHLFSCTPSQERINQKQVSNFQHSNSNDNPGTLLPLTTQQQNAFDALNSIQVQGQHLYSTFSGIQHDCFPPDTSFVISRDELLNAIEVLLAKYYTNISAKHRTKLAAEAVSAQEDYLVLQCGHPNRSVEEEVAIIPQTGSWILPNVLGRRDIILHW